MLCECPLGKVKIDNMEESEESFFSSLYKEKNHKVEKQISKRQNVCKNEVRNLFEQLNLWRKESQREFTKIIDLYTITINKSINNLVEEVCDLQTQLSDTEKERDGLRETVETLSCDIGKLSAKLPVSDTLPQAQEISIQDNQDDDSISITVDDPVGRERPTVGGRMDYQEEQLDNGKVMYRIGIVRQPNKTIIHRYEQKDSVHDALLDINDHVIPHDGSDEDATENEVDATNIERDETIEMDEESLYERNHICKECGNTFTRKSSLQKHIIAAHVGSKKYKCQLCPYASSNRSHFKHHIKGVHDKIRDYTCDECNYAASQKVNLKAHKEKMHNKR